MLTEKEKENIKRVFEKEERDLRRRIIFAAIGWIWELFIVGSVIYLLFKQCS